MIRLRINDNKERIIVPVTIFPDDTSQVWKIPDFEDIKINDSVTAEWNPLAQNIRPFANPDHRICNESECMHLFQLLTLLTDHIIKDRIFLKISYLPYARQDKRVSNNKTFALETFLHILNSFDLKKDNIDILCPHSTYHMNFLDYNLHYPKIEIPENYCILYADNSAVFKQQVFKKGERVRAEYVCYKQRNQLSGYIVKLTVPEIKEKHVAIFDDICDGGATFIEIARQLKERGVEYIKLYVTHGIFSKGKQVLYDAGINEIETYDYERFFNEST